MSMSEINNPQIPTICHKLISTAYTACVLPARHDGECKSWYNAEIHRLKSELAESKDKRLEACRMAGEMTEEISKLRTQLSTLTAENQRLRERISEIGSLVWAMNINASVGDKEMVEQNYEKLRTILNGILQPPEKGGEG